MEHRIKCALETKQNNLHFQIFDRQTTNLQQKYMRKIKHSTDNSFECDVCFIICHIENMYSTIK